LTVVCRQFLRELFATLCLTTVVLLLAAVGGRFLGYMQDAALGKYGAHAVVSMIALRLPEFLQLTLPLAFFLACVLSVSRAHADHESTVLGASGTSPFRYYAWAGGSAVVVGTLVAGLSLCLTPAANARFVEVVAAERLRQAFAALPPGEFHAERGGRTVTYADAVLPDAQMLRGVFIAQRGADGRDVVVRAERGVQVISDRTESRYLRLEAGRRYEGAAGDGALRVVEFGVLMQRMDAGERRAVPRAQEATPTRALDPGTAADAAELHWRLALPIVCVVGALLAVGLARVAPREGRFARLPAALVLFFFYYVLLLLNQSAIGEAEAPAPLGLWVVHAIFALVAFALAVRLRRPLQRRVR
jgi:lipopolysaccharide export system permease protein